MRPRPTYQVCLTRSNNHAHYEEFGRLKGTITVTGGSGKMRKPAKPCLYDFGTFRDHSWDIRAWAAIDQLLILLVAFRSPLIIDGTAYWYLDLTLVNMPGNTSGVARYTTGYLLGKDEDGGDGSARDIMTQRRTPLRLACRHATSILDVGSTEIPAGATGYPNQPAHRQPLPTTEVIMEMETSPRPQPGIQGIKGSAAAGEAGVAEAGQLIKVSMTGDIRRLQYFPDDGNFVVFEDSMDFGISTSSLMASSSSSSSSNNSSSSRSSSGGEAGDAVRWSDQYVVGYGTRQSGFRVGDFDPSVGGCG